MKAFPPVWFPCLSYSRCHFSKAVYKNTHTHSSQSMLHFASFFDTRACVFLHLGIKRAMTLVGFVWLLFKDSVTPVYKAAMWFPQLPSFHSKRPGSQCSTVSAIHPRSLRDSALLKRTSLSPCFPSSVWQHKHRSDGAASLPWQLQICSMKGTIRAISFNIW